ncbi:MAG TPA: glycine cleavage system protein GcvH [Chloroflexota bacterium]|nr:glycine cleavage system protein GcvH [Chloroflexota bacterium]
MEAPADLKYSKEHEWARVEADVVTVGITDFAQNQLGDVVYVELPKEGAQVKLMAPFGVVESVKTASDLFSPVSGEVIEVNSALADQPELVNASPYNEAWMIRVRMSNPADLDQLLSAGDYERLTADEGH